MWFYSSIYCTVSWLLASFLRTACDIRCLKLSLLTTGGCLFMLRFPSYVGEVRSCSLSVTLRHLWSDMSSRKFSLMVDSTISIFLANIWSRWPPCLWVVVGNRRAGVNPNSSSALLIPWSCLLKSPQITTCAFLSYFSMSAAISEILAALLFTRSSSPGSM